MMYKNFILFIFVSFCNKNFIYKFLNSSNLKRAYFVSQLASVATGNQTSSTPNLSIVRNELSVIRLLRG